MKIILIRPDIVPGPGDDVVLMPGVIKTVAGEIDCADIGLLRELSKCRGFKRG